MPPPSDKSPDDKDSGTGLPGFRSWKSVYVFVAVTFVVWLAALSWLTHRYA